MKELSIIVPVYNMASGGRLEYCLRSLVSQTVSDYEIIAVDDCSQDGSYAILKRFAADWPDRFIAVRSPENRRQGGAKNIGLDMAAGAWVGFVDSDDWVAPDMYEKLLAKARETGADMVGCDYHLTSEHSDAVGQVVANGKQDQCGVLSHQQYRSLILDGGSLAVKIYRRSIFEDNHIRFPEHIFYEDNAVSDALMLHASHYEYLPEPLYAYYQHPDSTVHTVDRGRLLDRMEAGRGILRNANRFGYLSEYRPEICFEFTRLFYVNTLSSFIRAMGREMRETFPDFQENPYYLERLTDEERKLIAAQQKSTLLFLLCYKLLWAWRRLRAGGRRSR